MRAKRRSPGRFGRFQVIALGLTSAIACAANGARAADQDPIAQLVGRWDLRGTLTSFEIREDHSVYHSRLGAGDIEHENFDRFKVQYRHQHLSCIYSIRKYSEDELSMVVAILPANSDCDLGEMRRAPGSKKPERKSGAKTGPSVDASSSADANIGDKTKRPNVEAASELASPKEMQALAPEAESGLRPGSTFRECDGCPDMIVVPGGTFKMGSPAREKGRNKSEGPIHTVAFPRMFAVGRHAVTRDEFLKFVKETNYPYGRDCYAEVDNKWVKEPGATFATPPRFSQEGDHPVVCVNWMDAQAYVKWVSEKTGKRYRLLTEAEREYVARAGSSTPYWWGGNASPNQANFDTRDSRRVASKNGAIPGSSLRGKTRAANSYSPNPWGLYNVHGNVAEWVEDCWNPSYAGLPADGSPARTGNCGKRVLRGGAWSYWPEDIRSAYREAADMNDRYFQVGFRIARDVN